MVFSNGNYFFNFLGVTEGSIKVTGKMENNMEKVNFIKTKKTCGKKEFGVKERE